MIPSAATMPTAMGRSNDEPSFFRPAGARLAYLLEREIEADVLESCLDAVPALLHGSVGKPHHREVRQAACGDIDLNFDQMGINSDDIRT